MTKLYSDQAEDWTDSSESILDAITSVAIANENIEEEGFITIYEGIEKPCWFHDFLDVDGILENMQNSACGAVSKHAEDYLDDVTQEQKNELELLIVMWAKKHDIKPDFCLIGGVKEIKIEVDEKFKREYL